MLTLMVASFVMSSCSKDEDGSSSTTSRTVVVKEDGTVTGCKVFSADSEKTFYVDYIRYEVVSGHLEVKGYDEDHNLGDVKIGEKNND